MPSPVSWTCLDVAATVDHEPASTWDPMRAEPLTGSTTEMVASTLDLNHPLSPAVPSVVTEETGRVLSILIGVAPLTNSLDAESTARPYHERVPSVLSVQVSLSAPPNHWPGTWAWYSLETPAVASALSMAMPTSLVYQEFVPGVPVTTTGLALDGAMVSHWILTTSLTMVDRPARSVTRTLT